MKFNSSNVQDKMDVFNSNFSIILYIHVHTQYESW
jgi:hypothetical protein